LSSSKLSCRAWKDASPDWVEEKRDGAVEVIATALSGATLALEHTLMQPFVGEKFDSEAFMKAFGRIEKNPLLTLPGRALDVIIPINAIPKGYQWEEVGADLLGWLMLNHTNAPVDGESSHVVPVAVMSKLGPLPLTIILGSYLISRHRTPGSLEAVVAKALRTKIPMLVATQAEKRILLLERDQIALGDGQVYREIVKLAPLFPDLARIDDVWLANTAILATEGWVYFTLMDGRGLVEMLAFENAVLKRRRDDRPDRREQFQRS